MSSSKNTKIFLGYRPMIHSNVLIIFFEGRVFFEQIFYFPDGCRLYGCPMCLRLYIFGHKWLHMWMSPRLPEGRDRSLPLHHNSNGTHARLWTRHWKRSSLPNRRWTETGRQSRCHRRMLLLQSKINWIIDWLIIERWLPSLSYSFYLFVIIYLLDKRKTS